MPGVNIRRIADGVHYDAANHFGMQAIRLQGLEAGGPARFWVGLSHILPGGYAGPDAGAIEKVYVILDGTLTLRVAGAQTTLGPRDSICLAPGVERVIVNDTNDMVTMLVVIPTPAA